MPNSYPYLNQGGRLCPPQYYEPTQLTYLNQEGRLCPPQYCKPPPPDIQTLRRPCSTTLESSRKKRHHIKRRLPASCTFCLINIVLNVFHSPPSDHYSWYNIDGTTCICYLDQVALPEAVQCNVCQMPLILA